MSVLLIAFPERSKQRQWTVVLETGTVQQPRQPDLSKTVASGARFSARRATVFFLIYIFRYVHFPAAVPGYEGVKRQPSYIYFRSCHLDSRVPYLIPNLIFSVPK